MRRLAGFIGYWQISTARTSLVARLFYGFALIVLVSRYFTLQLLNQLESPVLIFPNIDNTYWILHISGIPSALAGHHILALIADIFIIAITLSLIIKPKSRYLPIIFTIVFTLYSIVFNSFSGHHFHGYLSIVVVSLPFWATKSDWFSIIMNGVRYYTLFIFGSAGLWKLFRGVLQSTGNLLDILKVQHFDYLIDHPDIWLADFCSYLMINTELSVSLFEILTYWQLSFILGFFTKKVDLVFAITILVFFVFNLVFMHVNSFILTVLIIPLLPWERVIVNQKTGINAR